MPALLRRWAGMRRADLPRVRFGVLAAIAVLVGLLSSTPAYAGTLTSASFTAPGANSLASAQNTAYTWGFTTATSATLSRVSMGVPSGTGTGLGARYLALNGVGGNYASTPDSVANSIAGDLDIRTKIAATDWTPVTAQMLVAKWQPTGNQFGYQMNLQADGSLTIQWSTNGSDYPWITSSVSNGVADGATKWLRSTLDVDNGVGNSVGTFYTSDDGSSWSQLGSIVTSAPTSIYNSSSDLEIGANVGGNFNNYAGKVYSAEVRNGINGTVVSSFSPATADAASPASWTSSVGEVWMVGRSGTSLPADVAADLTTLSPSGLPTNGTASMRMIDSVAIYSFTPTAVGAAIPCAITLQGFTNTPTAGTYTSLVATYNNAGTPAIVDSTTSPGLVFTSNQEGIATSIIIDPEFSFSVANAATACNGESGFVSAAGTSTAVALGGMVGSSSKTGGQTLAVTTNVGGGFAVYVRGTQTANNLQSANHNFADTTGTYASPAAWAGAGTEAFGYTYADATVGSSAPAVPPDSFIALNATPRQVAGSANALTGTSCVSFGVSTAANTSAGTYRATIVYTAVPAF